MTTNLDNPTTLVELLRLRAQNQPDKQAYTFLKDGETEEASLTYAQLEQRVRVIAAKLQSLSAIGERALLLYPPGLDYIAAFLGCLCAGVVAVPTYPPRRNRPDARLQAIAADAQATVVLTTTEILSDMAPRLAQTPALKKPQWLATDNLADELAERWHAPDIHSNTLAFLQYTSGSTGTPKGVMVSHGNVLHNSEYIKQKTELTQDSVSVTWLPSFHDMGLIDGIIQPLYSGFRGIIMSPIAFLQQPIRWLKAISRYQATHSGGPNFAYDLCTHKITPKQRETLDLSNWCSAYNGSEPVRRETLERFVQTFESCGFRASFFYPCYGLAENTVGVSGGFVTDEPVYCAVETTALEQGRVIEASPAVQEVKQLVGCGQSGLDTKIVIVDPKSLTRCWPNQVGEIWLSGSSVAQGYWNRPEETEQTFNANLADTGEGPFLRTGDLGFLQDGELFVTGRIKDLIIIRGRNYYPQDIELTVENSHPALSVGSGAAFSVERAGEERLIIAQEIQRTYLRNLDVNDVVDTIRQAVSAQHELPIDAVVLFKTGTIPKTSSGKIQRHACRAGFLANNLNVVGEWHQPIAKETPVNKLRKETIDNNIGETIDNNNPSGGTIDNGLKTETIDHNNILRKPSSSCHFDDRRNLKTNAEAIQKWLSTKISQQIGVATNEITIKQPFSYYGIDSVTAVGLSGELSEWLEQPISPTLVYDYPTIEALAQYLNIEFSSFEGELNPDNPNSKFLNPKCKNPTDKEDIAIIGIGCRFPQAKNPNEFWQLLKNGVDAITEIPTSRWDTTAFYDPTPATPGKMNTRWGGFIDAVDQFDPAFFSIAPREAERMDPQQRLLLEVSWEALENAGIAADALAGSQTGVFIGISSNDYAHLQWEYGTELDAYSGTGNALCIAANRLSYGLDLHGPSKAVDTACSSSLVAVHDACQSLRQHECELALAGGVNLMLSHCH